MFCLFTLCSSFCLSRCFLLRILCRHIHAQTLTHRISKGCIIATKYGFKSDYLVSTAADNDNCLFRQGYQDGRAGMVGSKALLLAYGNRPLPETFLLISLSREYRANLSTLSRLFCKRKNATGTFTVETGTLRRRSTACEHAGSTPAVVCFSN